MEDLMLYNAKGYLFCNHLVFCQCVKYNFHTNNQWWNPSRSCEKNQEKICSLNSCFLFTCTTFFDLWMSHTSYDTFVTIINFINSFWELTHVIVDIFKEQNQTSIAMANQVKILFDSFGLFNKVIAYVKNKWSNLSTLTIAL